MPGFDRTGPMGQGPMTGRGMGYCNSNAPAGGAWGRGFGRGWGRGFGRGFGRGWDRGFGFGRGWGRGYGYGPAYDPAYGPAPNYTPEQETADLRAQAQALEEELKLIRQRLDELEASK